jgi:hypothetical protein
MFDRHIGSRLLSTLQTRRETRGEETEREGERGKGAAINPIEPPSVLDTGSRISVRRSIAERRHPTTQWMGYLKDTLLRHLGISSVQIDSVVKAFATCQQEPLGKHTYGRVVGSRFC